MKKTVLITIIMACALLPLYTTNSLPMPKKFTLDNGLTVFYLQDKEVPLVAVHLLIKDAGTAFEPTEGLADLTATLLLKGVAGKSAAEVAEAIDGLGASLDISAADEYLSLSAGCLTEHFASLMGVADAVARKFFSDQDFVLVVVGKAEEISAQLAKFGDFKIKKITDAGF